MWDKVINLIKNKDSIEIGGPSEMLGKSPTLLYPFLKNIDGGNMDNIWQGDVNTKYNPHDGKYGIGYKLDISNEKDYENIEKKYDLVFSAHVIEHSANPIKSIVNLKNLLNKNGLILTILPNKTEFWDKNRETTEFKHIIDDYENNTTEYDQTHFDENYTNRDWSLGGIDGKVIKNKEHYLELSKKNFETRVMHHHCFDLSLMRELHEYCGFETLECFILPEDKLQLVYLGKHR